MKQYKTIGTLILLALAGSSFAQGYQVSLKAPQFKKGLVYLTYRMGPSLNVVDSAAISNTGQAIFKGKGKLPGGIYVIVLPGKRLSFDFFIDKEQKIAIAVNDTADLLNKVVVTGSQENILFTQYQRFVAVKGKQLQEARMAYTQARNRADSALHEGNYTKHNKELNDYRKEIMTKQPKSMMATFLKAMQEPEVPIRQPKTQEDSLINYHYYKAHYWDGVTFMDERVLRTPFFLPRLERYYREVIIQAKDTIIADIDYRLLLARTAPELYKYMLNWLTDEYFSPKYMGHDAIFVHLYEKYHAQGVSKWLNEKQMQALTRRAYMLWANLIGEKAANLEMIDSTGKPKALYDVSADYTVVCFWDPTCGHCKEVIPKIDSVYQASWKAHNVKIYAVLNEDVKTEWINYIKNNNLGDWIHVYQTKAMADADAAAQRPPYRQLYDVTQTPKLFLLDKEKRIVAKSLSWDQLDELLKVKWK
jgi:thiol-disulfide isomerase/thioredoxin